jgi:hypothetical protein
VPLEIPERRGRDGQRQQAGRGPPGGREQLGGNEVRLRGDARRDQNDGQDERRRGRQVRDGFEATKGARSGESAVPRLIGGGLLCQW